MTDNILSFDDLDSEQQIGALQIGLPRVVLEGQDDVRMFESWFNHLMDALTFVQANDVKRGAGCSSVAEAVRHSLEQDNVPAIGIVDRDNLFRIKDWPTLFATDDAVFSAIQTPDVVTTSLWEVEAYLIQPDLLPDWVEMTTKTQPPPSHLMAGAVAAALQECEALLEASPVLAAAHVAKTSVPDRWGMNHAHDCLSKECEAAHPEIMESKAEVVAAVRELVANIKAAAPSDPPARLAFLLRYVNTKRLLHRLTARLQVPPNGYWSLKKLMSMRTVRPDELDRVVTAHAERYAA